MLERKGVWGASVRKGVLKKSSNPEEGGKKDEEDVIDFENNDDCCSMLLMIIPACSCLVADQFAVFKFLS